MSTDTKVFLAAKGSIGELYPDIVIEENHEDSLEITSHPVEQGAAIHDHAYKKPKTVTIRGGVTDSKDNQGSDRPSVVFYNKLLSLQENREPFTIVTNKRMYSNMLIESLSVITDVDTQNCLMFTAQCKEVILVHTRVGTIPPRKRHANPKKTGSTETVGKKHAQKRKSMLKAGLS